MESEEVQGDKSRGRSTKEEMAKRFWKAIQDNRVVPGESGEPTEKEEKT